MGQPPSTCAHSDLRALSSGCSGFRVQGRWLWSQGCTWGNQRVKLCMTTAAIRVLPSPVGRQTRVLHSRAVRMMSSWYARSGTPFGYTQVFALNLQVQAQLLEACQDLLGIEVEACRTLMLWEQSMPVSVPRRHNRQARNVVFVTRVLPVHCISTRS